MAQNWREKQANKHEKPQLRQEVSTPSRMTLSKKTEELAANYRLKLLETQKNREQASKEEPVTVVKEVVVFTKE